LQGSDGHTLLIGPMSEKGGDDPVMSALLPLYPSKPTLIVRVGILKGANIGSPSGLNPKPVPVTHPPMNREDRVRGGFVWAHRRTGT
jgi:hypothetical protein